jgi:hypothetical protein
LRVTGRIAAGFAAALGDAAALAMRVPLSLGAHVA